jgi:hypothetical protein
MRRYGLYDTTRGLTTLAAAGAAGALLWAATRVGQPTDRRFWAETGIVAAAGLVMALSQAVGGWTKGLRLRVSMGTFALAFVPVLIVVWWIMMASQPGQGWYEGTIASWSATLGITGIVHDLALWHGVLAFGFGLVLGLSFDTVPAPVPVPAAMPATAPAVANEPTTAERREVGTTRSRRPREALVGPRRRRAQRTE